MINERQAKKFCKEDISKIENYDKAMSDTTQTWHCHHRDEIRFLPSGMIALRSTQELIENGRYYNCPANELIFLTKGEHMCIHQKNRSYSEETCKKLSEAHKGKKLSKDHRRKISESMKNKNKGKIISEFSKAFKEHYGITRNNNAKLYRKEHYFYKCHGIFSWEVK